MNAIADLIGGDRGHSGWDGVVEAVRAEAVQSAASLGIVKDSGIPVIESKEGVVAP